MAKVKISGDYIVLNDGYKFFDHYDEYNVLKIEYSGTKRFFCKCGHVEKDISLNKCPVCGNDKIYSLRHYDSGSYTRKTTFIKQYKIDFNIDKSIASFKVYCVALSNDSTKKEFLIEACEDLDVLEIKKDNFEILNEDFFSSISYSPYRVMHIPINAIECLYCADINRFDFELFRKEFKYFDNDFNEFKEYKFKEYSQYSYVGDFQLYLAYISIKKRIPDLFIKDINYVFISKLILSGKILIIKNNTNFDKIVNFLDLDDFKEYLNQEWFYGYGKQALNVDNYRKLSDEQKELIGYAVRHYKMSIDRLENFSKDLYNKSSLYSGKLEHLLNGFIKSNLVIFMDNTISEFEKRIQFLNLHKIPINENSIKNYSVYKNVEDLKSQKYPEKNVNLISDVFYDNPLKSMKYLKSKKNLTKSEIDELLDLIK